MPLVGCPGFRTIQQCGKTDCPVRSCFGGGGEVPVLENPGAKPAKGSGGQTDADLDVIIDVAGGGQNTA